MTHNCKMIAMSTTINNHNKKPCIQILDEINDSTIIDYDKSTGFTDEATFIQFIHDSRFTEYLKNVKSLEIDTEVLKYLLRIDL